jgi:hypothetical protein
MNQSVLCFSTTITAEDDTPTFISTFTNLFTVTPFFGVCLACDPAAGRLIEPTAPSFVIRRLPGFGE